MESSSPPEARLASSVTSRGKPMLPAYWRRVWKTAPWIRRLSGVTCEPSTLDRGVASWISSLEGTRVSRSVTPARDSAPTTPDTCGLTSPASLTSASPISSSVKTSALTCAWDSTTSPETFKTWATALRRHCTRRRSTALGTNGNGYSGLLLPTPKASADKYGGPRAKPWGDLQAAVRQSLLPTPTARDYRSGKTGPKTWAKANARPLNEVVHSTTGGQLSPPWVEWLMGWPIGWTDCELPVTESFRSWQQMHFWSY